MTAAPLIAAWQGARHRSSRWFLLALLALLGAGLPLGLWIGIGSGAALAALLSSALLLLIGAWLALVNSLLLQNTPVLARLVPGHVAGLRRSLQGVWLGLAGGGFLLSALLREGPLSAGLPLAGGLLALAACMRWPLLWALGWLPFVALPWLLRLPPVQAALAMLRDTPAAQWLLAALCLLLGAWLLQRLLQDGDARHERAYQRRKAWQQAAAQVPQRQLGTTPGWLAQRQLALQLRLYRADLERALRQGSSRGLTGLKLALGLSAHWSAQLMSLAIFFGVALLVMLLLSLIGVLDQAAAGLGNISFGMLAVCLAAIQQQRLAMAQRRPELGLLRLAPGLPRGAAANRALALRLMAGHVGLCLLGFGLLALLLPWPATHQQLLAFGLVALLSGLALWGNWSALTPGCSASLLFALPMGAAVLLWLGLKFGWFGLGPLLLAGAAFALLAGPLCWRRAVRSPPLLGSQA